MFWPFNHYPGSDYETFNYDWVIGKLKELKDSVAAASASEQAAAESAEASATSAEESATSASESEHQADLSAESATASAGSAASIAGVVDQVNANTSRISSLIAHAGDGTVPSELTDIRIGYDGTTYQTAGDAVRAQVEDCMEDVEQAVNPEDDLHPVYVDVRPDNLIDKNKLITGYYINASGVPTASTGWNCTDFIDISGITSLYATNIGLGAYYDAGRTFISGVTLGNQENVAPPSNAAYIRVSILPANVDTAIISYHGYYRPFPADFPVSYWKSPKKGYEPGYIRFTVPVNNTVANTTDTSQNNNEGTPDYVDVDCVLSLPYAYKPVGDPCKLIMMCHGAGRGVSGTDNWTENASYNNLVNTFISYGYAVFDCNGFENDALGWSFWGNQRGLEAWRKAYKYVTDFYNVEKTFSIYAFSMGGLTAMNLVFQGFPNVDAIAMGSPVLDLHEVWNATDGTKAVLQTLYGLGDTWDESKVVGDNPYKHVMTVDNVDYCPYKLPPIKIWYGSTETNNTSNPAIEKEIAHDFVNAITNSGGYAYYREVSGAGHEISYGGNHIINQEILYFLERYERATPERY